MVKLQHFWYGRSPQDLSQGFVGREQGGIKGAKAIGPVESEVRSLKPGGISLQKSVSFLGSFGFKTMRILVSRKFKFGIFEPPKNSTHHASQDCHGACIGIPTSCEPSKRVWAKVGKLAFNIVGDSTKYAHVVFFPMCVASLASSLILCFFDG
jgi:hypothetical protein